MHRVEMASVRRRNEHLDSFADEHRHHQTSKRLGQLETILARQCRRSDCFPRHSDIAHNNVEGTSKFLDEAQSFYAVVGLHSAVVLPFQDAFDVGPDRFFVVNHEAHFRSTQLFLTQADPKCIAFVSQKSAGNSTGLHAGRRWVTAIRTRVQCPSHLSADVMRFRLASVFSGLICLHLIFGLAPRSLLKRQRVTLRTDRNASIEQLCRSTAVHADGTFGCIRRTKTRHGRECTITT